MKRQKSSETSRNACIFYSDIETNALFLLGPGFTYNISFSFGNIGGQNMEQLRIGTALNQIFDTTRHSTSHCFAELHSSC